MDVGLVGFPSVGKSLISCFTKARLKLQIIITTIVPNLGGSSKDGRSFVMADLPGQIEGAAQGKGLTPGICAIFECCRVIEHIVDRSSRWP